MYEKCTGKEINIVKYWTQSYKLNKCKKMYKKGVIFISPYAISPELKILIKLHHSLLLQLILACVILYIAKREAIKDFVF